MHRAHDLHLCVFFFFLEWNRMNASVHVSAPWRSMSVLATSPMLKTGKFKTSLIHEQNSTELYYMCNVTVTLCAYQQYQGM